MKLSKHAMKLLNLLRQRPATYTETEIKRDLGVASKAALLRAVDELEEAGIVISDIEEV